MPKNLLFPDDLVLSSIKPPKPARKMTRTEKARRKAMDLSTPAGVMGEMQRIYKLHDAGQMKSDTLMKAMGSLARLHGCIISTMPDEVVAQNSAPIINFFSVASGSFVHGGRLEAHQEGGQSIATLPVKQWFMTEAEIEASRNQDDPNMRVTPPLRLVEDAISEYNEILDGNASSSIEDVDDDDDDDDDDDYDDNPAA